MGLLGKIWVKLGLDNSEFSKGLKDTDQKSNVFAQGFKKIGGMIAGAFAIESIARFGKELLELRNKSIAVTNAFKALNRPALLNELRAATNGTVNDLDLMRVAVMANNFKLPLEELATYFEFASKRARETGQSVDDLVEKIVTGLGRQSIMTMKNLGISSEEIAKGMESGATFTKAVADIIKSDLKSAGPVLADTISKSDQLAASWANFKLTLSQGFVGKTVSGFGIMIQEQLTAISMLFGGKKQAEIDLINAEDNEQAKKWLATIKTATEANDELARLENKRKNGAELLYQQMLKNFVASEKLAAEQKKASETTITGIEKQIESYKILAMNEQDPDKLISYVNKIGELSKKVSLMQMTSEERAKKVKEEKIVAIKEEISLLKTLYGTQTDEIDRAYTFESIAAKSLQLQQLEKEGELIANGIIPQKEREIALLKELQNYVTKDQPLLIKSIGEEISAREKDLMLLKQTNAELLRKKNLELDPVNPPKSMDPNANKNDPIKATYAAMQENNRIAKADELKALNDRLEEETARGKMIADEFGRAVADSIANSMRVIFDAIASGEKIDASSMIQAIVTPFADMAVQIGEVLVATGVAALAAKAIGTVGGGVGAIVAGAALIALGTAAQAAISNIGGSFGKGSSGGNDYNYQGGQKGMSIAGVNTNINVTGILKGEDIYLSSQKVAARKKR